jgi:hypothetical protein
MAGQAYPSRVSEAMPVKNKQVRDRVKVGKPVQNDWPFSKAE